MNYRLISKTTLLLLLGSLFISSCGRKAIPEAPFTLEEDIQIKRNKKGHYMLEFKKNGPWRVYAGKSPANIDWSALLQTIPGKTGVLKQFPKEERIYFGLIDADDNRYVASERRLQMKGSPNFRDLGGIYTQDGRMVKWGKIFRSGNLAELKRQDMTYVQNLGIKTICDFRYNSEIKKDPNKLPEGVKYHRFPIGGEEGLFYQDLRRRVLKEGLRGQEAKKEFIKVMELFADSAARDFKPVMDLLSEQSKETTPLLYHCSGGKDRTGYMTMVILATLGVDKQTIKNEYLMSNFYRYKTNKGFARKAWIVGIDKETLSYILVVQNEYFDAVFGVIEDQYGGLDNYLLEKYGVTPELRQALIEKYTVAVP